MKKQRKWMPSDIANADYIGILEFNVNDEWHNFDILATDDKLIFGGSCNCGFLESGYILMDGFATDEVLQQLLEELTTYYRDGKEYTGCIVANERM